MDRKSDLHIELFQRNTSLKKQHFLITNPIKS